MNAILVGYINPEETLVDITVEYDRIEAQVKTLLNTGPHTIDAALDFSDFRRQQALLLQQRDQLFNN